MPKSDLRYVMRNSLSVELRNASRTAKALETAPHDRAYLSFFVGSGLMESVVRRQIAPCGATELELMERRISYPVPASEEWRKERRRRRVHLALPW